MLALLVGEEAPRAHGGAARSVSLSGAHHLNVVEVAALVAPLVNASARPQVRRDRVHRRAAILDGQGVLEREGLAADLLRGPMPHGAALEDDHGVGAETMEDARNGGVQPRDRKSVV